MKKWLIFLLSAVMLFASVGCQNIESSSSSSTSDNETPTQLTNPIIRLNGFDEAADLDAMQAFSFFGNVEIQNDEMYLKNGNGSAKFTVESDKFNGNLGNTAPYVHHSMYSPSRGIDCCNFENTVALEIDVYNAQSEERSIGLQLIYSRNYNNGVTSEAAQWYTLKANGWTTVRYNVVRDNIPLAKLSLTRRSDSNELVPLVKGVDFMFQRPASGSSDDIFYVDDFRVYNTTTKYTVVEEAALKEGEICSFDQQWQVLDLALNCTNSLYRPSTSWSKAFTTDGGASLRVDTAADGGVNGGTYIQLKKSTMFSTFDFMSYDDDDMFCFDVYSPLENGLSGNIGLYLNGNAGYFYYEPNITLSPGNITQVKLKISDINASEYADPINGHCFQYLQTIQFAVSFTGVATTFYIDNIHMERAS